MHSRGGRVGVVAAAVVLVAAVAAVLVPPPAGAVPSVAPPAGVASTIVVSSMPKGLDRFVDAGYRDLLGRASDASGRGYWVRKLTTVTRTGVAGEWTHSNEWTRKVVGGQFNAALGRDPSQAEGDGWITPLRTNKKRVADLTAWLYGTTAFFNAAGGTNTAWLNAVFQRTVLRAPTSTESAAILGRLSKSGRSTEALKMVLSVEANGYRVDGLYRLLLTRESDSGGRAFWANRLTNGDDLALAARLAGSDEYYRRSQERAIDGTLAKPATTDVATAAEVEDVSLAPPVGDEGSPTAIAELDGAALPTNTTYVSLPKTADSPDGYLGKVTSRATNPDGTVTVGLAQARWNEAFPSGQFTGSTDLSQPADAGGAEQSGTSRRAVCSGSGNTFSLKAKTKIALEVDAGWGPLSEDYLSFAAKGSIGAEADVLLGGAFTCEFATRGWFIPFSVGPIPFTAGVSPTFTIDGEIGAHLKGAISFGCTVGMEWREGSTKNLTGCKKETSRSELLPSLAQGKVSASLGIDLSVKAFGVLGVAVDAGPTITATVNPLVTPWWRVTGGVYANANLVADLWILSAKFQFAKWSCCGFTIASATTAPPAPAPLAVTTATLPSGVANVAYSASLGATGGIGPYTWTATGLPAPLQLDEDTGAITGSPTSEWSGTVTVTATDRAAKTATRALTLTIAPLAITTTGLPGGITGTPYTATLTAIGGTPPYAWSASGLPAPLVLNASTGKITGTPTTAGSTPVAITATAAGKTATLNTTLTISPPNKPAGFAAGDLHTCGLLTSGTVKCWGNGSFGQLGAGEEASGSQVPLPVVGITNAAALATANLHACAVLRDGTARCWGSNLWGPLGNGETSGFKKVPVSVVGLTDAIGIAVGGNHSCALLTTGAVKCWGEGGSGALGAGPTTSSPTPVSVTGITDAIAIAAGGSHTCALIAGGTIKCWGNNSDGQLGTGTAGGKSNTPVAVTGISNAKAITAGPMTGTTDGYYTCALLDDGTARCWGSNDRGQLGNGSTVGSATPVPVTGISGATTITAGEAHACVALADGTARCWGANANGQLGNNTTVDSPTPVTVLGLTGTSVMSAGRTHTCASANDVAKCWGNDSRGKLGNGSANSSLIPVNVVDF